VQVPAGADSRWVKLLQERKAKPGDLILYDHYGWEIEGIVQSDGYIQTGSRFPKRYIDPVAFVLEDNDWASKQRAGWEQGQGTTAGHWPRSA
jgi:hypothetical protein